MRCAGLALMCIGLLSACGNPLADFPRLGTVPTSNPDASPSAQVAASVAETQDGGGGLFGRLLNRDSADPTNAAVDAALADVGADRSAPLSPQPAGRAVDRQTGGFFDFFRRGPRADALPRSGPDQIDLSQPQILPFGQMARICGLARRQLGQEVSAAGGFRLYDADPDGSQVRPFNITGFSDDCARTFAGAVVVPGNVETHEFVRYQPSNERIDYTTADNAYETLKASVCRVGRGQPCGGRSAQLNRNTLFVTVYPFFGGTFSSVPTTWAQILLHDGRVVAMSVKDG